jgi:hypothetical protein
MLFQVHCLEVERLSQENILLTVRDSLHCQQTNNSDLQGRILQLEQNETVLQEYVSRNLHLDKH